MLAVRTWPGAQSSERKKKIQGVFASRYPAQHFSVTVSVSMEVTGSTADLLSGARQMAEVFFPCFHLIATSVFDTRFYNF